jgi:hypothetical protein
MASEIPGDDLNLVGDEENDEESNIEAPGGLDDLFGEDELDEELAKPVYVLHACSDMCMHDLEDLRGEKKLTQCAEEDSMMKSSIPATMKVAQIARKMTETLHNTRTSRDWRWTLSSSGSLSRSPQMAR